MREHVSLRWAQPKSGMRPKRDTEASLRLPAPRLVAAYNSPYILLRNDCHGSSYVIDSEFVWSIQPKRRPRFYLLALDNDVDS